MSSPLSSKLPWELANPLWASAINPLLASATASARFLSNVPLAVGANTISHGLGRNLQGWIITDLNGAATIYRSQPLNAFTLTLTSSAAVTISLELF